MTTVVNPQARKSTLVDNFQVAGDDRLKGARCAVALKVSWPWEYWILFLKEHTPCSNSWQKCTRQFLDWGKFSWTKFWHLNDTAILKQVLEWGCGRFSGQGYIWLLIFSIAAVVRIADSRLLRGSSRIWSSSNPEVWQFNFHGVYPEWLLAPHRFAAEDWKGWSYELYKSPTLKSKCLKILAWNLGSRGDGFWTSQLLESATNSLRLPTLMVPIHHVSQERVAYSTDIL